MIKRIAVSVLTVAAVAALAGCGLIQDKVDEAVDNAVEDGVEQVIEQGAGDDVDVEFGENADLPADFPADVPIPDGSVTAAVGSPEGWFVTFDVGSDSEIESLFAAFDGDGWTMIAENNTDEFKGRSYQNDSYDVAVANIPGADPAQISMTVVPRSE